MGTRFDNYDFKLQTFFVIFVSKNCRQKELEQNSLKFQIFPSNARIKFKIKQFYLNLLFDAYPAKPNCAEAERTSSDHQCDQQIGE